MGRKQNARRNKSTNSIGNKKNRASSTSSTAKFLPHIDGYNTFLLAVTRLGNHGNEFMWHDMRKVYHKETQRNLTVEELNAIFMTRNLTKREIFDLPCVSVFLKSMDSMMCRFLLVPEAMKSIHIRSLENQVSSRDSEIPSSPLKFDEEKSKCIAISTDCDSKLGPTSDLSKSDDISTPNMVLSHQNSLQSSVTDDEGWVSGRETRSDNSSPQLSDAANTKLVEEDEVFSSENGQRIAAGSDEADGVVMSTIMVVDEKDDQDAYMPSSPLVITPSVERACEALVHSTDLSDVGETKITNSVEEENVPQTTPSKKIKSVPLMNLIEKFDTPAMFSEARQSPNESIYAKVLEENGGKCEEVKKEEIERADEVQEVVFRSAPTYSSLIENEKEELARFVAEQDERNKMAEKTSDSELPFSVIKQGPITSVELAYFESKMSNGKDLFDELNIKDVDGCMPKDEDAPATKSRSEESALTSEEMVTVIERDPKDTEQAVRERANSVESEDVPYSLCSEDEGEPMTLIEKSMSTTLPKVEKKRTEIVNVELDAKNKREATIDVSTSLKQRIAALEAAAAGLAVKTEDTNELEDGVKVLTRTPELEDLPLDMKVNMPNSRRGSNPARVAGRRQARFLRGCCVVM